MASSSSQKRYNLISIVTLVVILMSFGYYYFIFVKAAEDQFNEKAFRIMEAGSESIKLKHEGYKVIVRNAIKYVLKYDTVFVANLILAVSNSTDSVKQKKIFEEYEQTLKKKYGLPDELRIFIDKEQAGIFDDKISNLDENEIYFTLSIDSYEIFVKYSKNEIFENTLRRGFVKDYVAFIEYDKIKNDGASKELKILYSNKPLIINSPVSLKKFDSIIFDNNILLTTRKIESKIGRDDKLIYLTPINLDENINIYLAGLIDKSYFRSQTLKLSPISYTLIFVAFVVLVLFLPFLKLYLLSEDERLQTGDAVVSFLAIVLGSSFLFVVLMQFYTHNGPPAKHTDEHLKEYAEYIQSELSEEITGLVKSISGMDRLYKRNDDSKIFKYDSIYELDKSKIISLTWLNKHGYQLIKHRKGLISPRVNVSHRKYFKHPEEHKMWKMNNTSDTIPFFVQPIRSITDGAYYIMISKWSDDPNSYTELSRNFKSELQLFNDTSDFFKPYVTVAAVTKFESLYDLHLPTNVNYMLVDEMGNVMYHKDENKNLRENLLTSTAHNQSLNLALKTHKEAGFFENYDNKTQRFYVRPVGNLPIYLVIYSDADYERIIDVQIFSLSTILYFMFFILIFLQIGLFIFITSNKKRKTKGYNLFVGWLWPDNNKIKIYQLLSGYMFISICVYFIFGLHHNIFATLSFLSILISTNLISLKPYDREAKRSIRLKYLAFFLISFLAGIFTFFISLEGYGNSRFLWGGIPFFILSTITIIRSFNLYSNYRTKRSFLRALFSKRIESDSEHSGEKEMFLPLRFYFNFYIFLLVLSLSLVPIVSFYIKSYDLEKDLYQRNLQLNLARNIVSHESDIYSDHFEHNIDLNSPVVYIGSNKDSSKISIEKKHDTFNVWMNLKGNEHFQFSLKDTLKIKKSTQEYQVLSIPEFELLAKSRLAFDTTYFNAVSTEFLRYDSTRHYNWFSINENIILFNNSQNNYSSITYHKNTLEFDDLGWILKHPIISITLLAYLFVLVLMVLGFITFWSRKVFLLNILQEDATFKQNLYEEHKIFLSSIKSQTSIDKTEVSLFAKFIYLISPPYSGVLNYIRGCYQNRHEIRLSDALNDQFVEKTLKEQDTSKSNVVFVFDTDTYSTQLITIKTELILGLKSRVNDSKHPLKKLIIISSTQPAYKINSLNKAGDDNINNTICFNNYMRVIGNFMRIYYPIGGFLKLVSDNFENNFEMNTGHDILSESLWNSWQEHQKYDDNEEKLLNEESLLHLYYYSIWNSLEDREQYIIYDLAEDGLANYRNINIINNLLHKGILVYNNLKIELFRESFQNFILTDIDSRRALLLEMKSQKTGSWSNLKFPFVMVVVSLFIFLFITQQDVFNDVTAWLATAAASIPVLMRVFSGFSLFGKKTAEK